MLMVADGRGGGVIIMLTSANPNPKIIKKFKIQTLSETARLQLPTFGTGFVSDSKVIFVKNFSAPLCKCNAEKLRTENDCMICMKTCGEQAFINASKQVMGAGGAQCFFWHLVWPKKMHG